jgi:hypothetical protein
LDEKPTGEVDTGASIVEQIEAKLGGNEVEPKQVEKQAPEEAEKPADDAPDETEGPQYELPDVAKILGIEEDLLDIDEDGSLKIKTKIDGKEGAAKLQDFIKSYQLQGHIDARVRKQAEVEQAQAERVTQIEQFAQAKIQELDLTAQFAEQMLMQEAGQVNWDQLVMEDPIAYQTERHKFERKQAQVSQLKQSVAAKRNEIGQAIAWRDAQELQQEAQRLSSLVPEWADQKVRNTEGAQMRQWLQDRGVSERAVNALRDAGLVSVLREAFIAKQQAPQVAAVEKKVRLAPKLVRPGSPSSSTDRKGETVRGLKQQIRETGGKQGLVEYLLATGKV